MPDCIVVFVRFAPFAHLAFGKQRIVGTDELVIVERLDNGNPSPFQQRQDGWRDLVVDVVDVGDIRTGVVNESLEGPPRFERLEHASDSTEALRAAMNTFKINIADKVFCVA